MISIWEIYLNSEITNEIYVNSSFFYLFSFDVVINFYALLCSLKEHTFLEKRLVPNTLLSIHFIEILIPLT